MIWSKKYFILAGTAVNKRPEFKVTDANLNVPVVMLSTQDNRKLLKQLEYDFERTINGNKYLCKPTNQVQNRYLYVLINASFQGINRLFVFSC